MLKTSDMVINELSDLDKKYLLMLYFSFWGVNDILPSIEANITKINQNPIMRNELIDLLNLRREETTSVPPVQHMRFDCPFEIHAKYTRDEILVGLGFWDLQRQPTMREGVLHLPKLNTDAFFVTLNKSQKHYSPTTMYEDYAINERLFHWQSQSTTSEDSPTGQRYINHRANDNEILLFVRENRANRSNLAEPYYFLGAADYVSHSGSRPISITWRLKSPLPAYLLRQTSRLVVG